MDSEIEQLEAEYHSLVTGEAAELSPEPADESAADAADESAGTDETAAAHTSESADDDASGDEEPEEKPDDSEDESEEPADDFESPEAEPGSDETVEKDLTTEIPSIEELQKFPRTSPEAKAKMVELRDGWANTQELVDKVGGEKGVEVFAPLANILTKADAPIDDRHDALATLLAENEAMGFTLLSDGALLLLNNPNMEALGNDITKIAFGSDIKSLRALGEIQTEYGATPDHIKDLLKLEKAGLIDTEGDMEAFNATYAGSELYEQQKAENEELRQELEGIKADPSQLLQSPKIESSKAINEFETELLTRFESGVKPIREQGKWTDDSVLSKTVNSAVLASLEKEPEYREAIKFMQRDGVFQKENFAMTAALTTLTGKAKGRYQEIVRGIQADLRKQSETSQNAKQKAKVETIATKPKPVPTTTNGNGRPVEDVDALFRQFNALEKDKQLALSRSV